VVPRAGASLDLEALSRFVAERVAGYKRIREWEIVASIPRTPSGKIIRRQVRAATLSS